MLKSKNSPNKTIRMELSNNRYKERPDIALAVQQIGEIKREKDRIRSRTDDQIAKLLLDLQNEMDLLDLKIQHLVSGIKFYVDHHLEELFPNPEYKTCKLEL